MKHILLFTLLLSSFLQASEPHAKRRCTGLPVKRFDGTFKCWESDYGTGMCLKVLDTQKALEEHLEEVHKHSVSIKGTHICPGCQEESECLTLSELHNAECSAYAELIARQVTLVAQKEEEERKRLEKIQLLALQAAKKYPLLPPPLPPLPPLPAPPTDLLLKRDAPCMLYRQKNDLEEGTHTTEKDHCPECYALRAEQDKSIATKNNLLKFLIPTPYTAQRNRAFERAVEALKLQKLGNILWPVR